jgi:hypothetical protein
MQKRNPDGFLFFVPVYGCYDELEKINIKHAIVRDRRFFQALP